MKFLLLLLLFFAVAWRWRTQREEQLQAQAQKKAPHPPEAARQPVAMVACVHCGVHLPVPDTWPGRLGAYCCAAHQKAREG